MIEFWYEFASTYSYPAAMRLESLASDRGVAIAWRPFSLGPLLFEQQGFRDSPFNVVPVKGDYMWKDLARICQDEGLPLTHPSQFPRNTLLAARLAVVGLEHGWTPAFSRLVFTANFANDQDIADPDVLAPLITAAGGDPASALAATHEEPAKRALKDHVAQAKARGIFGSPSFMTADGELFWGNDRLEQAIDWAARVRPHLETA